MTVTSTSLTVGQFKSTNAHRMYFVPVCLCLVLSSAS